MLNLAETTGLEVLRGLYGFTASAAQFAVDHIETLKQADNLLANRCGEVLEAANIGFGAGMETAPLLIGVGQALLGNPLTARAAVLVVPGANQIAMTCAAIGAIHYGWNALSDGEKSTLLKSVGTAFGTGIEFIRSVADYAFEKIKSLMSPENVSELKRLVTEVAAGFGRRFSDVTRALTDRVAEGAQYAANVAGGASSLVWAYVPSIRSGSKSAPEEKLQIPGPEQLGPTG